MEQETTAAAVFASLSPRRLLRSLNRCCPQRQGQQESQRCVKGYFKRRKF
jgi:hypothetical protein